MAQRKAKESKNPILGALEMSSRLQDLYEYVAHRDLVFVEIPSSSFLVPRMEEEEVEDFAKTPIVRFYRGVHPLVLYVDNRIAVPVNSSLLQPYYSYLRYLVSTQPAVWAYAVTLTSQEVKDLYQAVFGEGLPEDLSETLEGMLQDLEEESLRKPKRGGYKEFSEGFESRLHESLEGEGGIRSVFTNHVLVPITKFFRDYFLSAPAGEKASTPSANYPVVTILAGHTGIAKSAIVKRIEDPDKLEHYIPIFFGGSGQGEKVFLMLRPKVFTYKIGSTRFSEFAQSMYAVREELANFLEGGKEELQGVLKLFHFNPILEPFFFSSDQFRFPFRSLLLKLVQKGVVSLRDPKNIERELKSKEGEITGVPVYLSPNGPIRLDLPDALRSKDPMVKSLATIVDFARPAVLFLDELDRNDALLVQMVVTTFFIARQSQGLTYYSTYLIGAWNRAAEDEKALQSILYLTAKTADPSGAMLAEGAFTRRFRSVYLHPSDPEVYEPVIDYLTERFEKRGNLVGVRQFLRSLANVKVPGPGGKTEYNLLYYLPEYSGEESSEDFQASLLKGFATFRSYERLLVYLSRKKEQKKKEDELVPIYMPFVGTILGYLFPRTSAEAVGKIKSKFKQAFSDFIKVNFGYDPYDPPESVGDIVSPSSSRVLEESGFASVPIALYGPPGLAKTHKAKRLLRKLNEPAFDKLKKDKTFLSRVVGFLRDNGVLVLPDISPEDLASRLERDLLMILIGTERSFSPSTVTGGGAPMTLATHRLWAPYAQVHRRLMEGLAKSDPFFEQYKEPAALISTSLYGGEETIVKQHASDPKAQLLHKFLKEFPEFRAVLVFDEITRADFVTQGSFFDALSERIILGEQFDPEPYSRVQMVATGNFTSGALFATEVNQVDAALVARFANFFQMEPYQEDTFEYQEFLLDHIKKALGTDPFDQDTFDELRKHIASPTDEERADLLDFGYFLRTLFTVSTRFKTLSEMINTIRMEIGEVENPPFLPSFRELEKFISDSLLSNWSPLYAFIPEFASAGGRSLGRPEINGLIQRFSFGSEVELSDLLRAFKDSDQFRALVESLDPGEVLDRLTTVATARHIYTPEIAFGYVAFIPYPDEKEFPTLSKFIRENSPELLTEYKFSPLRNRFSSHEGEIVQLLGPDVDIIEKDFAVVLETQFSVYNPFRLDWSKYLSKGGEKAQDELKRYIERMVLASVIPTVFTHKRLVEVISKVLKDQIFLFPGTTLFVEEADLDSSKVAKKAKDLRNTIPEQKDYFLFHMLRILHLFSKLKLSQIARVERVRQKEETVEDLVRKDLSVLRAQMEADHGTSSLSTYFDREKAEAGSGESDDELSIATIAENIAWGLYETLNRTISSRLGMSLDSLRTLYSIYRDQEDKVPPDLRSAYDYAKVYFERPDLLDEAVGGFNPDTIPIKDVLLSEPRVNLLFRHEALEEPPTLANISDSLKMVSISSFSRIKMSVNRASMEVNPPADALLPPLGLVIPGAPFEVAGLYTIPGLPDEGLGDGTVKISPEPAHLYIFQRREDGSYEAHALTFGVPVEDIWFRRELNRRSDEVLQYACNVTISFVNGTHFSVTTLSTYKVDQSILEKDLSEVLESEEFEEVKKVSEKNPEAMAFVGDLEVLAGLRKGLSVGGTTSTRKGAKADVEFSPSELRELRDMFNVFIAAKSPDSFEDISKSLRVRVEEVYDKLARGLDKVEEFRSRLFGADVASTADDLVGELLAWPGMSPPSDEGLGFGDEVMTIDDVAKMPKEKEREKKTKRKSIAHNTGFSTRLPLFLLTVLRRISGR